MEMNQNLINKRVNFLKGYIEQRIRLVPNLKSYHAAIVIDNNGDINYGFNSTRTSWMQRLYAKKVGLSKKPLEHAEIAAIRRSQNPKELLVIRLSKTGLLMDSNPCPICRAAIKDSGIQTIYYSNSNGIIISEKVL